MRFALAAAFLLVALATSRAESNLKVEEIYKGWLQMYNLRFDEAHQTFAHYREKFPEDPLAPASDAAAYLFAEFARLEVLESELFVSDSSFLHRKKLEPDAKAREQFLKRLEEADRLADLALQKSKTDAAGLFVKTLVFGLRADYATLIEKQGFKGLSYTKEGRPYAEQLLQADPTAFDAYLGPGIENYMLSQKALPLRMLLRFTGSQVDREKGLDELRQTAAKGYYLEPFAKLLLGVASLRDNQKEKARQILTELHTRFPENPLYTRELERMQEAISSPPPNESKASR